MIKKCYSYNQIIYSMLVLVNYHKDTFCGIGYRSEHMYMVGIHVQVDMYTERGVWDIIWGIHGEYPFAGGDVYNLQWF